MFKGDCSGPDSAKMILANKKVSAAVLETARGGIVRQGLVLIVVMLVLLQILVKIIWGRME